MLDAAGTILWMNERHRRSPAAPIVGSPWLDIWAAQERRVAASALSSALDNRETHFSASLACDSTVRCDVTVVPVPDAEGRITRLLAISRDGLISQGRDHELERERSTRLAVERETRKRDYALLVAVHELGGPLYAMRGWAQYLQLGNIEPSEFAEAVEAIERNTDRQYQLIERLLQIARFRSAEASPKLVPNSIGEIVMDAVECVRAVAGAKHIHLQTQIVSSAWVSADFDDLNRAFSNILINAIKFTHAGGSISIRCQADSDRARVAFSDNGAGVPPEFLQRIFEPFTQAAEVPSGVGVGLGLSIVRRIVELHHGTIHVSSAGSGCGTTFVVELPVFATSAGSE